MKDLKYCLECAIKHLGSAKIRLDEAASADDVKRLRLKLRESFIQLNEAEQHLAEAPQSQIRDFLIETRKLRKTVEKEIYQKEPKFNPEWLFEAESLIDKLNNFAVEQLITEDREIKTMVEGEVKKMGLKEKISGLFHRPKEHYVLKAKLDNGWQELDTLDRKITIREAIEQDPEIEEAERALLELWRGDKFVKKVWVRRPTAAYLSQRESMQALLEESLGLYHTAIKRAIETLGTLNTEQVKQTVSAIKEIKGVLKEVSEAEKGSMAEKLKGLSFEDFILMVLFANMGGLQQQVQPQIQQEQPIVYDFTKMAKKVEEAGLG